MCGQNPAGQAAQLVAAAMNGRAQTRTITLMVRAGLEWHTLHERNAALG